MPTQSDVFNAFYDKKYDEILEIFKKDSKLVNVSKEGSEEPLFQVILSSSFRNECKEILEYMVEQKHFDFSHKSSQDDTRTNINVLISSTRLDLLQIALSNPNDINPVLLESDGKLTYQTATEYLERRKKMLTRRPDSPIAQSLKKEITDFEGIVSLLRDATILHALAKDDATLLTKLEQAGGHPTGKMGAFGDERYLNRMITKSHVHIKAWFKVKSDTPLKSLTDVSSSLYSKVKALKEAEAKYSELEQYHLKAKTGLIREVLADTKNLNIPLKR